MEMSGGDGDVKPYLYSRNTIGHGNHNPKSQRPKRVKIDIGGSGERWWCLWKALGVCGSKRGHRGKIGGNYAEMARKGGVAAARGRMSGVAGCPGGRAGCPGCGSVDERDGLRVERSNPGQISDEFVDGNCGKDGGKLDPLDAKQIHGSNPTKLHHTNKSQKNVELFFVGIFGFRTKTTKSS